MNGSANTDVISFQTFAFYDKEGKQHNQNDRDEM